MGTSTEINNIGIDFLPLTVDGNTALLIIFIRLIVFAVFTILITMILTIIKEHLRLIILSYYHLFICRMKYD
jgi:hypothetical protein